MESNRPYDPGNEMDAEGIPDLETPINQDEGQIPPRDWPQGALEYGTTAEEQRTDEPIADRVRREVPETNPGDLDAGLDGDVGEELGGRLLEPGSEDVDALDEEKDSVASLVDDGDEGALSAEEAAMHITDAP